LLDVLLRWDGGGGGGESVTLVSSNQRWFAAGDNYNTFCRPSFTHRCDEIKIIQKLQ
jgi:hypothetical protein